MRDARLAHALRHARTDERWARAGQRIRALAPTRLAAGPGLVTAAFDISRDHTRADLLDPAGSLRLEPGRPAARVLATSRIGIGYAAEPWRSRPWRFFDPDSPAVSAR